MRLYLSWGYTLISGMAMAIASNRPNTIADFNWDSVNASTNLQYHNCYTEFQCARLILPMDWLDKKNQDNVTIAIIKRPAVVHDDDPSFGGTIFAQPGGPGVSGTMYGRNKGKRIQDMLDKPGKKHYEILSFDPRGMGHSTPKINCFHGLLGYVRDLERITIGNLDLNPETLAMAVAAAKADGVQCDKVHGKYLSFVGTSDVARDIIAILDKIEELRQHEANQLEQSRLELRSERKENLPRLQYIGISYGTQIGQFFASMFPGRVGRMVLDGVIDVVDATSGVGWLKGAEDVDKIIDMFFEGCFAASQSICALHREEDASGSDISRRVWEWADNLDEYPLLAPLADGNRVFIRASNIRALFLTLAYNPLLSYRSLAVAVDSAIRGNTSALIAKVLDASQLKPPLGNLSNYSNDPIIPIDAMTAVICADGEDVAGHDNAFWREYLQQHLSTSSFSGAFWAFVRLGCAGWLARPKGAFKGPFKTPAASKQGEALDPGRPAAPLFFTSNRYDPATPLENARLMVKNHPGAGLLVQEAVGHCALSAAMGSCSTNALADYFDTGVVPEGELLCETLRGPWDAELHIQDADML